MVLATKRRGSSDSGKIIKVLSKSEKGSVIRESYKPRHGVRGHCAACGWKFNVGGIKSKKQVLSIENEQKAIHNRLHKKLKQSSHPVKSLHIQRDFHAAEIPHVFDETAAHQATFSTTFIDVPGSVIASPFFVTNEDYLVVVTAQADSAVNNRGVAVRVRAGPTGVADSEAYLDAPLSVSADVGHRMCYQWWGVITPASAMQFAVQFRTSDPDDAAGIDLVTISVFRLSEDLTPDVHYKYDYNDTPTSITVENTDTTTNNAEVSIVPQIANHRWVILSKARFGSGIPSTTGVNSRISRSGQQANNVSQVQQEGEDDINSAYVMVSMRNDALSNVNNIYTEISKAFNTGTGTEGVSVTRTHSAIFMLDISMFRSWNINQDSGIEEFNTVVDYGYQVFTKNINPAVQGDVFFLGFMTAQVAVSGTNDRWWKARMQIDNTDPENIPTDSAPNNVTSKAYKLAQWDGADRLPIMYATMENLTAVNHVVDFDASLGEVGTNRGRDCLSLAIFSMELETGQEIKMVCNDGTMNLTDSKLNTVKGVLRTFVSNETMSMTETNMMVGSGGAPNIIQPGNFVMRMSGGAGNTSGTASLGGDMSTAGGGVITDITSLWDPVELSESTAGDTEHRCIYLTNTHPSLTMQSVKFWLDQNTAAGDEIRMGLGSAAANATEQGPLATEETIPSGVTFTLAGAGNPIDCGDILPGQKRSVWLVRIVPPNTPAHENNRYITRGRFYSDPS